ncbi:MAG: hypothetical protein SFT92_00455 [Rickettsiales bacterium]|nr:hypothetical protein [Rickettsiales bacterium]
MFLNTPKDVLRALSEGHIGWRDAAAKLHVDHFEQLQALMQQHGFGLYQPDADKSRETMSRLDALLYDEGEI